MLIKELQLSNFKVFADSVRFPIKPITLLYGANSSGKSSILQALLMLKQSLKEGIESDLTLSAKGNMVDLGSFTQFIHNHDLDRSFSFKMTFPPPSYHDPESIPAPGYFKPDQSLEEQIIFHDKEVENILRTKHSTNTNVENLKKCLGSEIISMDITFSTNKNTKNIVISDIDLYIGNGPVPFISYKINSKVIYKGNENYESEKLEHKLYYKFEGNFEHKFWKKYWNSFDKDNPQDLTNIIKKIANDYDRFTNDFFDNLDEMELDRKKRLQLVNKVMNIVKSGKEDELPNDKEADAILIKLVKNCIEAKRRVKLISKSENKEKALQEALSKAREEGWGDGRRGIRKIDIAEYIGLEKFIEKWSKELDPDLYNFFKKEDPELPEPPEPDKWSSKDEEQIKFKILNFWSGLPEEIRKERIKKSGLGIIDKRWQIGGKEYNKLIKEMRKLSNYDMKDFKQAIEVYKFLLKNNTIDRKGFLPKLLNGWTIEQIRTGVEPGWWPSDTWWINKLLIDTPIAEYTIFNRDPSCFLLMASSMIEEVLNNIEYIAPLREHPKRYYEYEGKRVHSDDYTGSLTPEKLFNSPELVENINKVFEKFGIEYKIEISPLTEEDTDSGVFLIKFVNTITGISSNIKDIGFGFSQVLPIIVQNVASKEMILLMEQPESQIHPSFQADLGDLFIESAMGEQKNTLIIETHSEHLLLRIMRRMRETATGKLKDKSLALHPDDIMVLYVESVGSNSIIREMPLNEYGDLVKSWPGGFFEEGLREVF